MHRSPTILPLFALLAGLLALASLPRAAGPAAGAGADDGASARSGTADTTSLILCAQAVDRALHPAWLPSDSTVVLPESLLVYDEVRRLAPDDRYGGNSTNRYAVAWQSNGARWHLPYSLPFKSQQYALLWCPLERFVPPGSHVISAEICLSALGRQGIYSASPRDTLAAVLLAQEGDGRWVRGPRFLAPGYGRHATASWNNQVQPARPGMGVTTAVGYAAAPSDSFPWQPPLDERVRTLDFGPRGRGHVFNVDRFALVDYAVHFRVDITRTAQLVANGRAVNRGGWLLVLLSGQSGSAFVRFRTFADRDPRLWPFVRVVYEDRPWAGPWPGGREIAYTFTSDDGLTKANDAWSEVFAEMGLGFTAFVSQAHQGVGQDITLRWDKEDLACWSRRGVEIGSHGRTHPEYPGLAGLPYESYEDLVHRLDPSWIDSTLAAAGHAAPRARSPVAEGLVFAAPHNAFNLNMVAIAESLGYLGIRSGNLGRAPSTQQVPGDSAGVAPLHASTRNPDLRSFGAGSTLSFNGMLVPTYTGSADNHESGIFGTAAQPADSAQIVRTTRLLIEDRAVRGEYAYWVTLTHNLNVLDNGYEDIGVNPDQLRWFLQTLVASGNVWVAPMGKVMAYLRERTVLMDHPRNGRGGGPAWQDRLSGARRVWRRWLAPGEQPPVPGEAPAPGDAARATPRPAAPALRQARPNPFNPTTRVEVVLTSAQRATVAVFDLRGRRVRVLHDGPLPAGATGLVWDGRDERGAPAASGTYVCRLRRQAHAESVKLLLAR